MKIGFFDDEKWMQHCLALAEQGRGSAAPNPMVGAALVREGMLIADGYHQRYGGAHAEVNALAQIPEEADLRDCTLYVNLEPCAHFGKTPPCADLLIRRGVGRVVVGAADLNPKVSAQGISRLRDAKIEVKVGVLERECFALNCRFYSSIFFKRPYVVLKWAESADRFIGSSSVGRVPISSAAVLPTAHRWRREEQAIMVGTNTARLDDPALTVRHAAGKNPIRIVIDRKLSLPRSLKIYSDNAAPSWIINQQREAQEGALRFIKIEFGAGFVSKLLARLYAENVQSLLVEGGAQLLQSFIESGYWDEVRVIRSAKLLGSGVSAPLFNSALTEQERLGKDLILHARSDTSSLVLNAVCAAGR